MTSKGKKSATLEIGNVRFLLAQCATKIGFRGRNKGFAFNITFTSAKICNKNEHQIFSIGSNCFRVSEFYNK